MNRVTRLIVLGSLLSALALEVVLVSHAFPAVRTASLAAFVAALALSLAWPRLGAASVLVFAYIAPAAISLFVGSRDSGYLCIWLAALAAPVVATAGWREWRFPRAWTWPLVLWLLSVALTWPIVVLRECNFDLHLLTVVHLANSGMGIPPPVETIGITRAALTLGLPLLWFEWLFGMFGNAGAEAPALQTPENEQCSAGALAPATTCDGAVPYAGFLFWVIAPLAVSWLLCNAAGLYQAFVHMDFLNGGLFGSMGRASGTMLDANPFGVITAMWGAALFALGIGARRQVAIAGGLAGFLLAWVGVWASGSRTAAGAAAIALLFIVWSIFRAIRSRTVRAWLLGGLAGVLALGLTAVAFTPRTGVAGFSRVRQMLPDASLASVEDFVQEMWNRNRYGIGSSRMIGEYPLMGVGVGAFDTLVIDYGSVASPDNAQNWYRHQLAQMGIVGSLGWIIWIAMLGGYWWRTSKTSDVRGPTSEVRSLSSDVRSPGSDVHSRTSGVRSPGARRFEATVILGTLVGVALVSLVGMPTANIAAALTVIVFLFWYVALVGGVSDEALPVNPEAVSGLRSTVYGPGWKSWAAMWVIVAVFVAGTAYVGATRLRPPYRALQFDWEYVSGFYGHEHAAHDPPFRWTSQRAIDVFPIKGQYLKLTFRIHHPEARQRPVVARVWARDRLIADVTLHDSSPVTKYVRAPAGQKRMMIETWVSRTWRPSDHGSKDTRVLGLQIDDWTFVDKPPAGAAVVQ